LVLAACVMAGSAVAAADQQAARGRSGAPGDGRGAAPAGRGAAAPAPAAVPVTPADVKSMLGTWQIPLETPTGRLVVTLVFRLEGDKVVAGVSAPSFPEHKITDITKSGSALTLKAATDYSGALSSYSGRVEMVLTLSPKGEDRAALFNFNTGKYEIGGTAKKQS
jgi:hypothetical protein